MTEKKLLFVDFDNSVRSRMAEAIAGTMAPDGLLIFSAGVESSAVDKLTVSTLKEMDIDIKGASSKTVDELEEKRFDILIFLCSTATAIAAVAIVI